MEFLSEYINPIILIICLLVGFVWKKSTPFANDLIPMVVTILGVLLNVVNVVSVGQIVDLKIIAVGGVSGLLSTGLHQLVTRTLDYLATVKLPFED